MEDEIILNFFTIITCLFLSISFIGIFIFIKTVVFCIKRYILTSMNVKKELTTIKFCQKIRPEELSPDEIVEKRLLKDKLGKFARDTLNEVKSNNYLSERKEGVIDELPLELI